MRAFMRLHYLSQRLKIKFIFKKKFPGHFVQDLKKHGIVLPGFLYYFLLWYEKNGVEPLVKLYHVFLNLVQIGLGGKPFYEKLILF